LVTYAALKPEYEADLAAMKFTRGTQAAAVAKWLLNFKSRFLAAQHMCGVPALWLMPVFYREKPSFNSYFGNGDPLDRPTAHVPRGRGPFKSWEAGVTDALTLDHVTTVAERLGPWDWPLACYEWELWNGLGPRHHGRPSGYVWAGTSVYQGGKYVSDGVWSPGTWDQQLGTVALASAIAALDSEISMGMGTPPSPNEYNSPASV
jgi:lysozyme family protein